MSRHTIRHMLLLLCASFCCSAAQAQQPKPNEIQSAPLPPVDRVLEFRAILQGYSHPENDVFFNRDYWRSKMAAWSKEGYNAIVWYGPGELTNGEHMLVRHKRFPEAREISKEQNDKIIKQMNWLFATAKSHGLKSYLQTQPIFYTRAFGKAHGLDRLKKISKEVGKWHINGYPNFWPSSKQPNKIFNCHVRNKKTIAYTTAVFEELLELYPDLSGFMGFNGEPVPGNRSTFFNEAIAPALRKSKRKPVYIANQWQTPLEQFQKNIISDNPYENLWLGFHGYNSEQVTDAKPYPGVVHWADQTRLPTVVEFYPANQLYFPFNSPRFAYNVAQEMKRVPGFHGFVYYERHISGTLLGPMFRQALARYASSNEKYDPKVWITALSEQFGSDEAAKYFLQAYDVSNLIIPEADAFIYSGGDVMRRELRVPYNWFVADWPWNYMTSPARGGRLIPFKHYVDFVAKSPKRFRNKDGSEPNEYPYYQQVVWASEGGSVFNITPEKHFSKIKKMGNRCHEAALLGLKHAKKNREEAQNIVNIMKGQELLAAYYDSKVKAAIMCAVYQKSKIDAHRQEALKLADKALADYLAFAEFASKTLDPYYKRLSGAPLTEAGVGLAELIKLEKQERKKIAEIFEWNQQ